MTKFGRLSIYYSWAAEGRFARRLDGALVSTTAELKKFRLN